MSEEEKIEENQSTKQVSENTEQVSEQPTETVDTPQSTVKSSQEETQTPESTQQEQLNDIDPKTLEKTKAAEILENKGFNYADLQKEFNETGDISETTKAKLIESGISEEMIEGYKEGQKALVEKEITEISQCVGGRETLDEVIKWAANNISDDEKISISQITDKNIMQIVLKDLKTRMEEKEGKLPENQISGDGVKITTEVFESQAQMLEAMKDPKYKTDEVYRAKVMKKIHASREAGIDLGI